MTETTRPRPTARDRRAFTRLQFVRLLAGTPFYIMVGLVFVEAALSAAVTYLVIQVGRDIVNDLFSLRDVLWILLAQISSYLLHTVSWVFGERAGFRAFARYLLLFAHDNRHHATLLNAKDPREAVEPFLTNETFHLIFEAMYETHEVHSLASGWNDLLALWARVGGVVAHMHPAPPADFEARIRFDRLTLRQGETVIECASLTDAVSIVRMQPTGRLQVRGGNGAGKSSLLAGLKQALRGQAYYWPTQDRLAFEFAGGEASTPQGVALEAQTEADLDADADADVNADADVPAAVRPPGHSSGERQIRALTELVGATASPIYLLDEWDANLDAEHRARAQVLVETLARRARVVEISHRD